MTRRKLFLAVTILGILGTLTWWQWNPFMARYYVDGLSRADGTVRESWAARVISLEEAAVPPLLAALQSADRKSAENLELALVGLVQAWGDSNPRWQVLLEGAAERFPSFTNPGKDSVLQLAILLVKKNGAATRLAGTLLAAAMPIEELRVSVLQLAAVLVERGPDGTWLEECRGLACSGLVAADADVRRAAIQLVLRPPLRKDNDLLGKVVPLLKDRASAVRKAALLALGQARELVTDDDLLPLLHDPDQEVRHLCELALRSRGLQDSHIHLARLISDPRPGARLDVLRHLGEAADLEPGVWLRRLCQDAVPAVRAAAVRAAATQSQIDLGSCLAVIAQQDPSPTVRQLAEHYLRRGRLR